MDQEDQQASENQVVQNRVAGEGDQGGAVIIRSYLDSRWQAPVVIYLFNGRFDLGEHVGGCFRSPHHHDRPNHVVLLVFPQNAEPWPVADGNLGDVANQHRYTVDLGQNHIVDIVNLVTLPQIIIATIVNEADAADIDGLLANSDFASAHVEVGVTQRCQDLRDGDAIRFELVGVNLDLELLGRAAPTVDGGNAGDGQQAPRDYPILDRAQVSNTEMRRPDHLITIDFPRRAVRLDGRHEAAGQGDVLLHRHRCLGIGEIVVDPIFEADAHKGQSIERSRADDVNAGRGVEPDFHRECVVALHLLSREPRRLRGNLQDHGRGVGVRLDVEHLERNKPGAGKQHQTQHHNRAAAQAKGEERFEHRSFQFSVLSLQFSDRGRLFRLSRDHWELRTED